MKKINYSLQITKPCNESWFGMTEQANGRFCASCSKTVVDLSSFSDAELIKFFQNKTDRVCGRLKQDQVNRTLILPSERQRPGLSKILAGLLFIAGGDSLHSENNYEKVVSFPVTNSDSSPKTSLTEQITNSIDSAKIIIKGIVVDEKSGEPVPFVIITIKETGANISTNEDGKFKIKLPDDFKGDHVTLTLNYIGYERKEFVMNKKSFSSNIKIKLFPADDVLLGDTIIIEKKE
jgi:hypothetical protein